jgi:exoribonuclease R
MVFMNTASGKYLAEQGTGVFRNVRLKEQKSSSFENPNTQMFFNNWDNISSDYSAFGSSTRHDTLGVEWYAQITSPIRRLVDVINQTALLKVLGISSESADTFVNYWLGRIEYLNQKMKQIRRVQNDCEIMRTCYNEPEQIDSGIIFDEVFKDGEYEYKVYLENLRVISSVKSKKTFELYSRRTVRVFLFVDESDRNRKIRLEIK